MLFDSTPEPKFLENTYMVKGKFSYKTNNVERLSIDLSGNLKFLDEDQDKEAIKQQILKHYDSYWRMFSQKGQMSSMNRYQNLLSQQTNLRGFLEKLSKPNFQSIATLIQGQ